MKSLKINHGAVWVIVILAQVIPAIWYTIFATPWMKYNNVTEEQAMGAGFMPYIVSIITSIAFGYMLAWVYKRMNITSAKDGLITGLIMGFPVTILGTMTVNMFSFRPYELAWIDGGVNWVIWGVAGLILGAWTKYKVA